MFCLFSFFDVFGPRFTGTAASKMIKWLIGVENNCRISLFLSIKQLIEMVIKRPH